MIPQERRLFVRKTPTRIGYLSLPRDNGGFVIDISEGGLGFQTIAPLNADGPIQIRFAVDSAERIRVFAEVAWIDETRRAGGLRFLKLPDEVRARIREWIGAPKASVVEQAVAGAVADAVVDGDAAPAPAGAPGAEPSAVLFVETGADAPERPLAESVAETAVGPVADAAVAEAVELVEPAVEQMEESVVEAAVDPVPESAMESLTWSSAESPAVEKMVEPVSASPGEPALESAAEPEVACSGPAQPAPAEPFPLAELATETPAALPALEAEPEAPSGFAPLVEIGVLPSATDENSILHPLPHSFYGGAGEFSVFSREMDSQAQADAAGAQPSLAKRHPVAAVALTVVLAFVTAIPISAYVSTSRAGEFLFAWSQRMWRAPASQTIPPRPAASSEDSPKLPPH